MKQIEILDFEKSSEMLDEEQFWQVVARSLKDTDDEWQQEQNLIAQLLRLSLKEIIGFELRTYKLRDELISSEMDCATFILLGGMSDDSFEHFRNWVISRGKETYYAALANPDNLIDEVSPDNSSYGFEGFGYVAFEAVEKKTGEEIYEFINYENVIKETDDKSKLRYEWFPKQPETMRAICP